MVVEIPTFFQFRGTTQGYHLWSYKPFKGGNQVIVYSLSRHCSFGRMAFSLIYDHVIEFDFCKNKKSFTSNLDLWVLIQTVWKWTKSTIQSWDHNFQRYLVAQSCNVSKTIMPSRDNLLQMRYWTKNHTLMYIFW